MRTPPTCLLAALLACGCAQVPVLPDGEEDAMARPAVKPPKLPPAKPPRPLDPGVFRVVEHELKNGLRIRLLEDHSVPTVTYYTFFRVGSRNERPGITGLAHLFEHMMFNGAKKYGPKEFDRVLEGRGGYSNAYTSNDVTAYYEDFASDGLETVIDLESDRMRSLNISPEMLKSERQVVMEERRLRVDNDITGMLDEALSALVWKAHPYHWPVIGWMGDIEAISREDAQAFFRTYYAPNNATIVAVGDLDPGKTLAMIELAYGDIPAGPPVPPVIDAEPPPSGERRVSVHYPSQAPALMIGWKATRARDADTFVLDVIQTALSSGESARLVKRLVYGDETVTGVMVDFGWRIDPGAFVIFAELKDEVAPAKVEAAVYEELARVAKEGLSEFELQKAKNILRAHFLHEIATNNGKAHALGTYEVLLGDWRTALKTLELYQGISNEDVKRVAARTFDEKNRSVATLVPVKEEVPAAKKPQARKAPRKSGPKEKATAQLKARATGKVKAAGKAKTKKASTASRAASRGAARG